MYRDVTNKLPDGYVSLRENLKNKWLFLKFQVTNDSCTNDNNHKFYFLVG